MYEAGNSQMGVYEILTHIRCVRPQGDGADSTSKWSHQKQTHQCDMYNYKPP